MRTPAWITTTALAAALALAAGCGSKTKPAANEPGAAGAGPGEPAAPTEPMGKELSQSQCEQVLDHTIALMAADPNLAPYAEESRNARDQLVQDCMNDGTKAEYDCFMAAQNTEQLMQCGGDEPK